MKKETDDESGRKYSEFMDNVDIEYGDENSMSSNPKRTVQKVSRSTANSSTSKATGLKSSIADDNAPTEEDGEGNPKKHSKN